MERSNYYTLVLNFRDCKIETLGNKNMGRLRNWEIKGPRNWEAGKFGDIMILKHLHIKNSDMFEH